MISEHQSFTQPDNREIRLWRYMDLSKFIAALQTSALYFARANTLGDPFEGSVPRLNSQAADVVIANRDTVEALYGYRGMSEAGIREIYKQVSDATRLFVSKMYISCWHMGEHESAAMWRLYSQSSDAICIQTTFARLAGELPDFVYAGMVNYINYETMAIRHDTLFSPFLSKRISFEHERELRAVMMFEERGGPWPHEVGEPSGTGFLIPVNFDALVENVFVSPTSAPWFRSVVEGVAAKYELVAPVHQSALTATPMY